jgi:hypothetical protein
MQVSCFLVNSFYPSAVLAVGVMATLEAQAACPAGRNGCCLEAQGCTDIVKLLHPLCA